VSVNDFALPDTGERLSARECDILRWIAAGWSNDDIAKQMVVSVNTVRWHNKQIYSKLGVHSRTLAIARAVELGLVGDGAPAATVAPIVRLPVMMTPFIGRQIELNALAERLDQSTCHLLTIVGPGGIGKTRLAVETSARRSSLYPDGVYFVPLAPLSAAEYVTTTLAGVLDITLHATSDPEELVLRTLADKKMLLVLDNFEHILDAAPLLSRIVNAAPGVHLLITSRERLNLHAEWLFELGGLETASDLLPYEDLEAVQLMSSCIWRLRSDFQPDRNDQATMARICQLLDGIPLGIELTSAWSRVLSLPEIIREIEQSFDFVSTTMIDVPPRHRSLRAVFEHSWATLSNHERDVLKRLSVFNGGFTREAAEAVTGASLDTLTGLIDKSLLHHEQTGRCTMHEMVRQYAASHLEADHAEAEAIRDQHCRFYAHFIDQQLPDLKSGDLARAMRDINADVDNVRAAMRRIVAQHNWSLYMQASESLGFFQLFSGLYHEGLEYHSHAVSVILNEEPDQADPAVRLALAANRVGVGWYNFFGGNLRAARSEMDQALLTFRELGSSHQIAHCLHAVAQIAGRQGQYDRALMAAAEGLEFAEQSGDAWVELSLMIDLAGAYLSLGRYDEARHWIEQARPLPGAAEGAWGHSYLTWNASLLAFDTGQTSRAVDLAQAMLETTQDRLHQTLARTLLARIALDGGDISRARDLYHQVRRAAIEMGDGWNEIAGLTGLGLIALSEGDLEDARETLHDALRLAREKDLYELQLRTLVAAADWMAQRGQIETAAEVLRLIIQHPAAWASTRADAERVLFTLKQPLTPALEQRIRPSFSM
jgi:predicted ATPase/DNA-binding CsgD family transcriptional regulator/Tfp pilus assembly protein PilF